MSSTELKFSGPRWCAWSLLGLALVAARADGQDPARERRRTPVVTAVEKILPCIVNVKTQERVRRRRHPLDSLFQFHQNDAGREPSTRLRDSSLGAGVVIDEKGYVVTNDHVVRQAARIKIAMIDGKEYLARVIGRDPQNDIAVLKLESDGPFRAASLGRSNDLMIGETTIATGNPFGLGGSVTTGILSAVNREVRLRGKKIFKDFLQTSAVINPGNSGGPLLNINGEVIGINVAIHSRGPGIGFAIPISRVREVLYNALDPRISRKAWLGFDMKYDDESNGGAWVSAISKDGPASISDLEVGDRIQKLNGERIDDWIDFRTTLQEQKVGQAVELLVHRNGGSHRFRVLFAEAPPSQAERKIFDLVGMEFTDLSPERLRSLGNIRGVLVTKVIANSRAEAKGIKVGDVIYQLGNGGVSNKSHALRIIDVHRRRRDAIAVHLYRETEDEYYGGDLPFKR